MGFKDSLDRLRSTRIARAKTEHETKEHDEMAAKYEKKKKFHEATRKPKSESLKDKAIKKVMEKGKDLANKSKQHAINELKNSKSKKNKKNKTRKSKPESKELLPTPPTFDFGFSNQNNEGFGFSMFNPQPTAEEAQTKEIDWSKIYNFRNTESPKKKKNDSNEMWDFRWG